MPSTRLAFVAFLALGLFVVNVTLPAHAQDQHLQDKYQEYLANNAQLVPHKQQQLANLLSFLDSNGVPYYSLAQNSNAVDIDQYVSHGSPTCVHSTTSSPGPVVLIKEQYQFPQDAIQVYVFGPLKGDIIMEGMPSFLEAPNVDGNIYAGILRPGDGSCYADTTVGMWSSETRKLITPSSVTLADAFQSYIVLARDFQGKPEGTLARFRELFRALLQL